MVGLRFGRVNSGELVENISHGDVRILSAGGVSPFGTRHPMPVYMEGTILYLPGTSLESCRRPSSPSRSESDATAVADFSRNGAHSRYSGVMMR